MKSETTTQYVRLSGESRSATGVKNPAMRQHTPRSLVMGLTAAWNFVVDVLSLYGEARARKTLEVYHPEIALISTPRCEIATSEVRPSAAKVPPAADRKLVTANACAAG